MEEIHQCVWKVGNAYWDINIPDYTSQSPRYLAELVVDLVLDKENNQLSEFLKLNETDAEFEEYICVENDKTDDVYYFLSEEIINSVQKQ